MHSYENLKREYGNQVSQTIDGPIMFMDHFDLWDLAISLFIINITGSREQFISTRLEPMPINRLAANIGPIPIV